MATDVPSAPESGLPDFVSSAWFAIAAPQGTPTTIIGQVNASINEVMRIPQVRKQFAAQGAEVMGGSPQDMDQFIRQERQRWKTVIRTANVRLD